MSVSTLYKELNYIKVLVNIDRGNLWKLFTTYGITSILHDIHLISMYTYSQLL